MRIYKDPSKIKQLLMTSFPVENEDESKTFSVWLKLLSWTFNCNNQICIILFLLGSGITGLRPCFQFSNWKKSTKTDSNWASKSCSIPSRVRRIRWACPFFPTEKFGRSSKLKLKATIIYSPRIPDCGTRRCVWYERHRSKYHNSKIQKWKSHHQTWILVIS